MDYDPMTLQGSSQEGDRGDNSMDALVLALFPGAWLVFALLILIDRMGWL